MSTELLMQFKAVEQPYPNMNSMCLMWCRKENQHKNDEPYFRKRKKEKKKKKKKKKELSTFYLKKKKRTQHIYDKKRKKWGKSLKIWT